MKETYKIRKSKVGEKAPKNSKLCANCGKPCGHFRIEHGGKRHCMDCVVAAYLHSRKNLYQRITSPGIVPCIEEMFEPKMTPEQP